jgi:hypothetical protein
MHDVNTGELNGYILSYTSVNIQHIEKYRKQDLRDVYTSTSLFFLHFICDLKPPQALNLLVTEERC